MKFSQFLKFTFVLLGEFASREGSLEKAFTNFAKNGTKLQKISRSNWTNLTRHGRLTLPLSGEPFQPDITITKLSATGCLKVSSFCGPCC
jgi:hypothetical protein